MPEHTDDVRVAAFTLMWPGRRSPHAAEGLAGDQWKKRGWWGRRSATASGKTCQRMLMEIDRVDGADTGEPSERQVDDAQVPADMPGSEGPLSRAGSRIGAIAANEKPALARSETAEAEEGPDDQVPQPYAKKLDTPIADDQPTPRDVLCRFAPAEAGLPEVSEAEAAEYIARNVDRRPWLASAEGCHPAVQRVLVAMDQGRGHALERHEGYADDDRLQLRVTALEDPAQLDAGKRAAGIDGCKPGNQPHKCGVSATAVQDPVAFATMFARGVEHPKVKEALGMPFDPDETPKPVSISVRDLLGADGHNYCSGYTLEPIDGSLEKARADRAACVVARRTRDQEVDAVEPACALIDDFRTASTQYFFRPTRDRDGYEISTM